MDDIEVGVLIQAKDQASSTLRRVKGEIVGMGAAAQATSRTMSSGIGRSLQAVHRELGGFGKNVRSAMSEAAHGVGRASRNLQMLGATAGGLALAGGAAVVKWAGDFDASLRTINTIAREDEKGLARIGDGIRKVARDTGVAHEDLTSGYYDLLSAGVKTADAQSILNDAVNLGIGGLATTAETVDLLTTAMNAYGLDAKGVTVATDMFAKSIERGKIKAAEIGATFSNIAPVAAENKIGIDQIAAAYALLTSKGQSAGKAMTGMQRAILELQKPNKELLELQEKTGQSFLKIAREKGLVFALNEMRVAAKEAGVPFVQLFGRQEGYSFALNTTGKNMKAYNAELREMARAGGTSVEQARIRQEGWNHELQRLKTNLKDAGITLGSAFLPHLATMARDFSDWLGKPEQQENLKVLARDLAQGFREVAQWVGSWDFEAIGQTLKDAVGFAKGLLDAFSGAPEWLKTAVITGWGLNKLTGGALMSIGGDLTKGIVGGLAGAFGKGLFERGGSPASPMFVEDVTGSGPGVGGAGVVGSGKGGGILSTLGKSVLAVSVVGMAAGILLEMGNALANGQKRREEAVAGMKPQAQEFVNKASLPELLAARNKLLEIQTDDMKSIAVDIADIPIIADILGTKGMKLAQNEQLEILNTAITAREKLIAAGFQDLPGEVGAAVTEATTPKGGIVGEAPTEGEPATTPTVKVGTQGARAIGEQLAIATNRQTRELQGNLTRIETLTKGVQGAVEKASTKSDAIAARQAALLSAILSRSRDIVVTVRPAPITLFVDGRAVANALTQELVSRTPTYDGGLP